MNGNEELAFHSLVNSFGSSYHFPLIDFGKVDRGVIDANPLRELSEHWQMSFSSTIAEDLSMHMVID